MNRVKKMAGIFTAAGLFLLSGTGILGYWKLTGNSGNILTMASFRNQIEEEYTVPDHVDPGQTVDKVVHVKNTGTTDSLIRVRIRKTFGDRLSDGTFREDPGLDPEMIQLTCDTEVWEHAQDGFYYYKDILKAGTRTSRPLLQSYTLSEKAGNEYRKKEARIVVTMEAIQAQDAIGDIWGMTYRDLGIQRPENARETQTEVIYLGQKGGFQMTESETDLFASFKNLTPGCARSQSVLLKNRSAEEVQLYLRAESMEQENTDVRNERLIREMMEKYAIIEITGSMGTIYKGPVSGNLEGNGSTMKEDLYLGTLKGKETRTLQVKLGLSEKMDNEFCTLTGKVRWVFTAKGEDGTTVTTVRSPATGDTTELGMWIALLGFSAVFLTGAFALERSYSRRKEHETDKRNP